MVASWVTFEPSAPKSAPSLYIGKDQSSLKELKGVSHVHKSPAGRTCYMHFMRAEKLAGRVHYYHQAQSGGKGATKSAVHGFQAPCSTGVTKVDIYGDYS